MNRQDAKNAKTKTFLVGKGRNIWTADELAFALSSEEIDILGDLGALAVKKWGLT